MADKNKVLTIAANEVGYLEKKSNSKLDSETENAGSNNYTKYWRDLAPGMNGQAWCNCFVNWCFTQAYGATEAKKLLCSTGGWSYYTPTSAGYFKNKKQWYTANPKKGDIIYFKNSTRIHHVGIVYDVDSKYVYTIEGNTRAGSTVIANGGGVAKKKYALTNGAIAGYGRPAYTTKDITPVYSKTDFIKELQAALGVRVDGGAGPVTLSATPTISKTKNNKHKAVLPVQKYLNTLGYNCGTADGIAGTKFDEAVKKYQSQWTTNPDGELTNGGKTWKKLLGLA